MTSFQALKELVLATSARNMAPPVTTERFERALAMARVIVDKFEGNLEYCKLCGLVLNDEHTALVCRLERIVEALEGILRHMPAGD